MPWGFKTRLALWHGAAVALILAGAALAADWGLSRMIGAQVDAALVALAETEAASALGGPAGRIRLYESATDAGEAAHARLDKLVQIVDAEGRVVERSASLGEAVLPVHLALLSRLRDGEVVIETVSDVNGEPVRLVSLPIEVEGRFSYAIQVGTSLQPFYSFLRTARFLFLAVSTAILVTVLLTGALLARKALLPIDRIVAMARRIGESNLGQRLPHPETHDEIGRLVSTLNEMLDRIERSFEAQRRFTADASHELRSPLSRLRVELEVALRRPRSALEYEAILRSSLEEVERLSRLTETLLALARLDAGEGRAAPSAPVALQPLVEEGLRRLDAGASRREIAVALDSSPGILVSVAPEALALVIANLLENAVKFSPAGGRVSVRVLAEGGEAVLTVSDTGPGIPGEETPKIFERFYRGDASRSPDAPGAGLGLAISRAIVEAHGGRIAVDSAPGAGAAFTVRLPLAT